MDPPGEKRFLLFYRWVQWAFLFLALCFCIPRKFFRNNENPHLKKLIEELSTYSIDQTEEEQMKLIGRACTYIQKSMNTHEGIYFKYVACNIFALFVDTFSVFFLNFVFQGRFSNLGWKAFPYTRDSQNFSDYLSQTFPPFAWCEIKKVNLLTAEREETFGCHLTVMELYEKIALFAWFWLIALIIFTYFYTVFLMGMTLPFLRRCLLTPAKPAGHTLHTINSVVRACSVGDAFLLYVIKKRIPTLSFYELIASLSSTLDKKEIV